LVLAIMFWRLGAVAFDARLGKMLIKTVFACGVVVAVDRLLLRDLGAVRLSIDLLLYAGLVLAMGAGSMGDSVRLLQTLRASRSEAGR
jgi:hypothetical protein